MDRKPQKRRKNFPWEMSGDRRIVPSKEWSFAEKMYASAKESARDIERGIAAAHAEVERASRRLSDAFHGGKPIAAAQEAYSRAMAEEAVWDSKKDVPQMAEALAEAEMEKIRKMLAPWLRNRGYSEVRRVGLRTRWHRLSGFTVDAGASRIRIMVHYEEGYGAYGGIPLASAEFLRAAKPRLEEDLECGPDPYPIAGLDKRQVMDILGGDHGDDTFEG